MNHGRLVTLALIGALISGRLHATEVAICTDRGRAVLELAATEAPLHVANFLRYVDLNYYTGMVFHRVQAGFIVQGGGVDRQLRVRATLPPVANESSNGLSNVRGTVAAARTDNPDSAAAQFFVNLADNPALDDGREPGYTVFGRITDGLEVFEAIGRLPTGAAAPFRADVPTPLVAIRSIARIDEAALAEIPAAARETALKTAITAAAQASNAPEALRLIGQYRSVCGAADAELSLLEARMALMAGERPHALFTLADLLATTAETDAAFAQATVLYAEASAEPDAAAPQPVAGCVPPQSPTMPDATAATLEQMVQSQSEVRAFVAAGETYLRCLTAVIDDEERSAAERNAAVGEHNRMVAAMEEIAAAFNERIRRFKARG